MATAVQVVQSPSAAAALLKPDRLRILELLAEPDSAAGVARRIELPRQSVNYHLHELEKEGFVEFVEHRKRGNCEERIVRATARSFVISPAALGAMGVVPAGQRDRFSSAYLVAASARVIRDAAVLRGRADRAGKKLATLAIETEIRFASAESRRRFTEEAAGMLAALAAKYHDERSASGRSFRFLFAGLPAITKEEPIEPAPVSME